MSSFLWGAFVVYIFVALLVYAFQNAPGETSFVIGSIVAAGVVQHYWEKWTNK